MKPVTVFESVDGARFNTQAECAAHEDLCLEVGEVMEKLRPRPDDSGCNFSNGGGFLQHSKASFLEAQRALSKIARRSFRNDTCFEKHFDHAEASETPVGLNIISRLISEGCPRPLDRAWYRLCCVDSSFREWGQPFYAINPHRGEQVPL